MSNVAGIRQICNVSDPSSPDEILLTGDAAGSLTKFVGSMGELTDVDQVRLGSSITSLSSCEQEVITVCQNGSVLRVKISSELLQQYFVPPKNPLEGLK